MKVIAIVSGGMDSATLLYWLLDQGHDVDQEMGSTAPSRTEGLARRRGRRNSMKRAVVTVPLDMGEGLEPLKLDDCAHEDLQFDLNVCRVVHEEGQHPHTLQLEVNCRCNACGERMQFRGARHAITFREPAGDIFGWTLSAPMEPSGHHFTSAPEGEAS